MAVNVWANLYGTWTNRLNWSTKKVPQAGDTDVINRGVVRADNLLINGQTVTVNHGDLQLNHSQISPDSTLTFASDAEVDLLGNSSLRGSTVAASGNVELRSDPVSPGTIAGSFTVKPSANVKVRGPLTNNGHFAIDGGKIEFTSPLTQTKGDVTISNGGTMLLDGAMSGGMIQIQSGMLDFAATPIAPISIAASHCYTTVNFTGQSGGFDFGQVIADAVYRSGTNDLLITVPAYGGVLQDADIHLAGSYTQSDFTVKGSTVLFSKHGVG